MENITEPKFGRILLMLVTHYDIRIELSVIELSVIYRYITAQEH